MQTHARREIIETANAPLPIGPYSQAVACGSLVFCSGQLGVEPGEAELVANDAASQADQALRNLGAILQAAGIGYADVLKTTVFLIDMNDFAAVGDVYARYFSENNPARSTVAVCALPKGARVEIEAVARRNV